MRSERRRHGSRGLLALACVGACATAACLPRGEPPAGRQLVADRTSILADVLPPSSDGSLRVLVTRPRQEFFAADLFLVVLPADGSAPFERALGPSTPGGSCLAAPCFESDARGRLVVGADYDFSTGSLKYGLVDPETGDRFDLGTAQGVALSPSGQRLLVTAYDNTTGIAVTLYEADDRAVSLMDAGDAQFVGETVFYVTSDLRLMRVLPNAAPEQVRSNVNGFSVEEIAAGPLMELYLATDDPSVVLRSVIDPVTFQEIFPPRVASGQISVSSDGRWMVVVGYGRGAGSGPATSTLVDATTGAEEDFETPAASQLQQWRPGRAELWLSGGGYDTPPATWIKRPGEPLVTLPAAAGDRSSSIFTSDGTYWYSTEPGKAQGRTSMFVGSADDPTAPRVRLNPDGSDILFPHELGNGRFLVESFYSGQERSDISVVDARTGESRLLGREGRVLTVGGTRTLAMLHSNDGAGDLAVLDLDGGASTSLATEFGLGALAEPRGTDRLGAGSRVVLRFTARFASPYDGIWAATLP